MPILKNYKIPHTSLVLWACPPSSLQELFRTSCICFSELRRVLEPLYYCRKSVLEISVRDLREDEGDLTLENLQVNFSHSYIHLFWCLLSQWLGQDHLCAPRGTRDATSPIGHYVSRVLLDSDEKQIFWYRFIFYTLLEQMQF